MSESKFTLEKSLEQAEPIKQINELALLLDTDYLTDALSEMRENHSMRESMSILNPSPFTHNEQQDLNEAKLEQLELMLKLAENGRKVMALQVRLGRAKGNVSELNKMFGQ